MSTAVTGLLTLIPPLDSIGRPARRPCAQHFCCLSSPSQPSRRICRLWRQPGIGFMAMDAKIQKAVAEVQKTRELAECMKKKEFGQNGC